MLGCQVAAVADIAVADIVVVVAENILLAMNIDLTRGETISVLLSVA